MWTLSLIEVKEKADMYQKILFGTIQEKLNKAKAKQGGENRKEDQETIDRKLQNALYLV